MRTRGLLLFGLATLLVTTDAGAWPANLVKAVARDSRRVVPRSLSRLIADRESLILEEAARFPTPLAQALAADLNNGQLRDETLRGLDAYAGEVVELFKQQRVSEGMVRLGGLLRIPADLSDPVLSVGAQGYSPGVVREYYAFVEASLEKIPVVLEDPAALKLRRADLPAYWRSLLDRSRIQSPLIETELFKNGRLISHRSIDYRAPVFSVASLSYSRAVTAVAATWVAVWREARGDVTRMRPPRVVVPRDAPRASGASPPPTAAPAPPPTPAPSPEVRWP